MKMTLAASVMTVIFRSTRRCNMKRRYQNMGLAAFLTIALTMTGCQTANEGTSAETTAAMPWTETETVAQVSTQPTESTQSQHDEEASSAEIPAETVVWTEEDVIPARERKAQLPSSIENGRNLVKKFYGDIVIDGSPQSISLNYYEVGTKCYYAELTVGVKVFQIPLEEIFWPETVETGFQICDVNQDGHSDIVIEEGIMEQFRFADCFVYEPSKGFVEVPGFSGLYSPTWSEESKVVIEEWSSPTLHVINRYSLSGAELVLQESLSWKYTNGGVPLYRQQNLVNGEMVTVGENISETDIDLEYWYS